MKVHTLTREVVFEIAQLKISDPQLKAFRARLLIAYTTGLRLELAMKVSGKNIEDNCLVIPDDKADKMLCIPLHPLLIKLFESYGDQFPAIRTSEIAKYNQQLMKEMGIKIKPYKVRENEKWVEKDTPSTRWLRQSMLVHTKETGLLDYDISLLSGLLTKTPEDRKRWEPELNKLFKKPFFKPLKHLAEQHGI